MLDPDVIPTLLHQFRKHQKAGALLDSAPAASQKLKAAFYPLNFSGA